MTTNDIDAIRKLTDAATPGPWWFDESDLSWRLHGVAFKLPPPWDGGTEQVMNKQILKAQKSGTTQAEYWPDSADAEFIAAARTHVPALCDEVEQLRAELAQKTNTVEYFKGHRERLEAAFTDLTERNVKLTAERDDARKDRDDYADDNTRVAVALVDVQRKLAATEAERDAARDMANEVRELLTGALHALDKARAVIEAGLSSDERRRAANAIRAYIRLCGSRIESDHPLHTIADKLAAAVDALPEPHADLYGDGHWVNRDGTCWSDCPACHPLTTEATANTDDKPCCGYRCQDNTTGVTA